MAKSKQAERISAYRFQPKQYTILTPEQARYAAQAGGVDIMAQYVSMRKVAQERLRKLEKAGLSDSDIWRENVNRFPSKKEIGSDARLLYDAIADVSHFLAVKKSTVGGYHEIVDKAAETFTRHYGSEGLTGMDWKTFGKMMGEIKSHSRANAYYRGWKNAYRNALSMAKKRGMSAADLNKAVSEGAMRIGPRGGLHPIRRSN